MQPSNKNRMQQRKKSEKRDMFSETGGKKKEKKLKKKKIKGMEDKVKNYFKQENKRESA